MKHLLVAALLAWCAVGSHAQPIKREHTVRYVGATRHDLNPLYDWLLSPPEVRTRTVRPSPQWAELPISGATVRTNGWTAINVSMRRDFNNRESWIAIRNLPTNSPPRCLLYSLGVSVSLPVGAGFISATAYDYGLPAR